MTLAGTEGRRQGYRNVICAHSTDRWQGRMSPLSRKRGRRLVAPLRFRSVPLELAIAAIAVVRSFVKYSVSTGIAFCLRCGHPNCQSSIMPSMASIYSCPGVYDGNGAPGRGLCRCHRPPPASASPLPMVYVLSRLAASLIGLRVRSSTHSHQLYVLAMHVNP